MHRFFVELPDEPFELLREWARVDRRAPREQAAVVLEQAIRENRTPAVTLIRPDREPQADDGSR